MKSLFILFLVILFALLFLFQDIMIGEAIAKKVYTIGGKGHPWAEVSSKTGEIKFLDTKSVPGSIRPFRADSTENLAPDCWDRGGKLENTLTYVGLGSKESLSALIDRNPKTAISLEVTPGVHYGTVYWLDLGAQFMITRIRFYPTILKEGNLSEFPKGYEFSPKFLPRYSISFNDGSPKNISARGYPIYKRFVSVLQNMNAVVDIKVNPPQLVRNIQFWWVTPQAAVRTGIDPDTYGLTIDRELITTDVYGMFEVAEFEVYGQGFVPYSSYTSDIIDMGDNAAWGNLMWELPDFKSFPDAKIQIQTRSGNDEDPNMYWRKTGLENYETIYGEDGKILTRETYLKLSGIFRGSITPDTKNWSPWVSYNYEAGQSLIISPGPRRYFQIKIEFINTPDEAITINTMEFEYSSPPLASELVGEISPSEVVPSKTTRFIYAVKPTFKSGDYGYDGVEITTPTKLKADAVKSLKLDGSDINFSAETLDNPYRLAVHFPEDRIDTGSGEKLLEIEFDALVLRYGTAFDGRIIDSKGNEVKQWINPGNAIDEMPDNTLAVRTLLGGSFITSVNVSPKVLTPNGDGKNDVVQISFSILQLTIPTPVSVKIFRLDAVPVKTIYSMTEPSGQYLCQWDGKDKSNRLVPPGIYIYQISVKADYGEQTKSGTLTVAY